MNRETNMAEAAVESQARFFCHKCSQEINPLLPDYICPRCQCGFIEELEGPSDSVSDDDEDEMDTTAPFPEFLSGALLETLRRLEQPDQGSSARPVETQSPTTDGSQGTTGVGGGSRARVTFRPRHRRPTGQEQMNRQPFAHIIQEIVENLTRGTGAFPMFVNVGLHGNPADYVWGRGGFDAVITQLLNQLDGTGPPPLAKEKISEIPHVIIGQEQVDINLQCTVCMEDFSLGENVRRLPCEHHFHNDCIVPWLELHGTCPICRKVLADEFPENFTSQSSTDSGAQIPSDQFSQQTGNTARRDPSHPHSTYDFLDDLE